MSGPPLRTHCRFDVRGQLFNRPEHGPTEFIRSSPIQTPVKSLAYISACQPKVDVILFFGDAVLNKRELEAHRGGMGENTPLSWSGVRMQNSEQPGLEGYHRHPWRGSGFGWLHQGLKEHHRAPLAVGTLRPSTKLVVGARKVCDVQAVGNNLPRANSAI